MRRRPATLPKLRRPGAALAGTGRQEVQAAGRLRSAVPEQTRRYFRPKPALGYAQFAKQLDNCVTLQAADALARDFCQVNNKLNRRNLANDVYEFRKDYHNSLPYFCRLVASVAAHCKDLNEYVAKVLLEDFARLGDGSRVDATQLSKRTRNLNYICEFVKFRVIPPEAALKCFKTLIRDFTGPSIELIITFLQKAGRFLYLNNESRQKFVVLLNYLQKLQQTKALRHNLQLQIDNQIQLIKSTSKVISRQRVEKSLQQQYVRWLLFVKLSEAAAGGVLQALNK